MGSPLVSVLVPAYNAEAFIGPCLRSVMDQTYDNIELIVVEDCSSDATFDVAVETLRGWPRATVLRNEVNLGNRENFRRLLEMGHGPLVKGVCADDLLAPDALTRLVGALEDPDVAMATSRRRLIDEVGADLSADLADRVPQPPVDEDTVFPTYAAGNDVLRGLKNWIGEPTTVLFRRGHLVARDSYTIGTVTPQRNLDVVWWLKILRHGKLAVVSDALSSFRVHSRQVSQQSDIFGAIVLAWYDIIVGARQIGYMSDPADETSALLSFVDYLRVHAASMQPSDQERVVRLIPEIMDRLTELSETPSVEEPAKAAS